MKSIRTALGEFPHSRGSSLKYLSLSKASSLIIRGPLHPQGLSLSARFSRTVNL